MADDVTFTLNADSTPPNGTVAATDETTSGPHSAGAQMGIAKLAVSANGDSTHVPATAADGLLVEVSNFPAGGGDATAANQVAQTALLTTIDADTGTLAGAVAGTEVQVDVVGALPAGTNNIGDVDVLSLPSIPAGNNNIGDVDIASSVLPTGASTLAEQQTQTASLSVLDDWDETNRAAVNLIAGQVGVQGASGTVSALTQRVVLATDVALPAGTNAIGKLSANSGVDIGDVDVTSLPAIPAGNNNIGDVDIASLPNEGQQTMANSISVAVASDQSNLPTKELRSATGSQTSVADNAASVTLIAANASRVKVLITNDSSARLYILFNASAASLTAYGVSLAQHEAWEELNYTGEIRGIWATDPGDGAARVTEFS